MEPAPGPEGISSPGITVQPPGPEGDESPGITLQPPGPEGDESPGITLQPPGPEGDESPGITLQPPGPEGDESPGITLQPPGPEGDESPGEYERLRVVFDMFDLAGEGLIRLEDFCQIASSYGAEQVKELTKYLDPAGLGVIGFDDFCRGIAAIKNNGDSDSQNYDAGFGNEDDVLPCSDGFEDFNCFETNEVTDSAYMGSESTYSECETFTDEDTGTLVHHGTHDELETDSAIDATLNSEFTDTPEDPENSVLFNGTMNTEEHFEDYGESNENDFASSSLCQDGGIGINGHLNRSSLLCPSDHFTSTLQSIIGEEMLEFYCTQCHKQINRLEDLSARISCLEMNSPIMRLSSKKVARHLQSSTAGSDSMEDLAASMLGHLPADLTEQVMFLEKRVTELEQENTTNGEVHSRLKQENLHLVHRANALEEQLKEQETKSEQMLLEEIKKQKDVLSKVEREQVIEMENLHTRLQQLDEENSELRACIPCLRANVERLEEEKRKLLDEMDDLIQKLKEEQENNQKLSDRLLHKKYQFQKEKETTQELIEDLRKQLEQLQLFKLEAERLRGRSSSIGLQEYNCRNRETELEQEIKRLKQDNRNLKEQNDELNGQIINLSIQGAKSLYTASITESLAAEISSVSRDELMDAIQKQEEINYRLQDYIDRIVVAIMETNPAILEIKQTEAHS
ncbi:rab11 family-interacting protein 3 isoform X2 [Pristis pectinata]|uniref:rab11 family-interacting protein 3 isoform X2 n=1 Tax=Pristis pectinata TaxID=685728 RepID=UPI00223E29AB|nr:rab11 family-interacting protein 3 isoform X2 [Pristis pectinata]